MEKQTNGSDTLDFVSNIQATFCPEQPICGRTDIQKSRNILATLPEYLPIGNLTVRTENISAVVGLCCYPCSCTCEDDDNCCPTKRVNNNSTKTVNNNTTKGVNKNTIVAESTRFSMSSECAESTLYILSTHSSTYMLSSRYYMIQECFRNISNNTLVSKCENPRRRTIASTIPVTSVKSGLIYRNEMCAICNNDDEKLLRWNATIHFKHRSIFDSNALQLMNIPKTRKELDNFLFSWADVIYAKDALKMSIFFTAKVNSNKTSMNQRRKCFYANCVKPFIIPSYCTYIKR